MDFCWQSNVSAINMLSRLVIAFLPRSKPLLISWLQSPSAMILEPQKIVCHYFHCFPIYLPWSDGTRCHDLSFLNDLSLNQLFHSPLSLSLSSSLLSAVRVVSSACLRLLIFLPAILIPACASPRLANYINSPYSHLPIKVIKLLFSSPL